MERKKYKGHLSLEDRQQIHLMRARGCGFALIGRTLGRDRSVIMRELERNRGQNHIWRELTPLERAVDAHSRAKRRGTEAKKGRRGPHKLAAVRERIVYLLEEGHYSPEAIADELSHGDLGVKLCGRTIRRWLLTDAPELRQHLPHRGKSRRNHLTPNKRRIHRRAAPEKRSIHERPEITEQRERVGDLEGDMIVSKKSSVAVLSVIDRKTRRRWYRKVANLKAETVLQALIQLLLEIPPTRRHTITFDRGGEFAEWKTLERLFGVVVYFCDPYCACQKGSVERSNKEFRRFVPKGTNLALVSEEDIARIEQVLNLKPMQCLEKLSALQAWRCEQAASLH
jgi:IS30 family transposase